MQDHQNGINHGDADSAAQDAPAQGADVQSVAAQLASDAEAVQIAKAALLRVGEYYCWAGPLLEAVGRGATGPAVFATSWGGNGANDPTPDPEKHAAYVAHVRNAIGEACSWLLPLLDAAGAIVVVNPGVFCFMVSHLGAVAFDIPQLLPITRLTPWADPDETMH